MKVDYHIHSPYCGHAQGSLIQYVESALLAGLDEIGFADHLGRYYLGAPQRRRYWDWGMDERLVERYVTELTDLQDTYKDRIRIRLGLEVDYIEGGEELLNAITSRYPLDFVLGSIHCLPEFGWRHLSEVHHRNPEKVFQAYFDAAEAGIKSGCFQVLAHLDFVWRYVRWPRAGLIDVRERIAQIIALAAKEGVAIEVNANSYLWSQVYRFEEWDTFEHMLDCIRDSGAVVTMGSDAHAPKFVAKAFTQLYENLVSRTITRMATFSARCLTVVEPG